MSTLREQNEAKIAAWGKLFLNPDGTPSEVKDLVNEARLFFKKVFNMEHGKQPSEEAVMQLVQMLYKERHP